MQGNLTGPHLRGDRRIAEFPGLSTFWTGTLLSAALLSRKASWAWWCERGMTPMAELSPSSMASQAVITRLGDSGQEEASWCRATRLALPGSLANRWLWRRITVSPSRFHNESMMRLPVTMSQMPGQHLCQLTTSYLFHPAASALASRSSM